MKYLFIALIAALFISCNLQQDKTLVLQNRIDSLEHRLANVYRPGFGEFMSSVQVHHAKLWFAGINNNWGLADFEIHEMMEAIENIKEYQTERKESKLIGLINPALDSVNAAIQQKNPTMFNSSYQLLTTTCNNCHQATNFEFNVVKIPDAPPPFSNQDFKINK